VYGVASEAMIDIPTLSVLDKGLLIGGCTRLPLQADAQRLSAEVGVLPAMAWGTTGGRVGVHAVAQAIFLRGYAPAEGDRPIENRPVLTDLPYVRWLLQELIPAIPLRCLLARLPGNSTISLHVDRAPYFQKSVRLHIPIESHDRVWMMSDARCYQMRPGEVWALNNSAAHGVWNSHPTASRTHLICDFLPSPELLQLLGRGERDLELDEPEVEAHLWRASQGVRPQR
jgi:hypothetical protein